MKKSETILNELKATSTILAKGVGVSYIVPKNYFDNFSSSIINLVDNSESIDILEISYPNYSIPNGYFTQLPSKVLASIVRQEVNEELAFIAPNLATVSNIAPYQVSNNYFKNFSIPDSLLTNHSTQAKVISINKSKWFQIAVAASVACIIVISGYYILDRMTVTNNYSSYKSVDVQGTVKKVSDDDLEKYLNNNEYLTSNTDMIIGDENEELNPKQEIKSVSDNELIQYLKDAGNSKKTVKKGI